MVIEVRHKKGKHFSNLSAMLWMILASVFKLRIKVLFPRKMLEDLTFKMGMDEDYADFCKLYGRKGLIPSIHAGSLVGREEQFFVYRPARTHFEVTRYWRKKGKFDYEKNVIRVIPDTWTTLPYPDHLTSFFPLPPYFCGNDSDKDGIGGVAPCDITYCVSFRLFNRP